jgi:hypothetical protein
MLQERERRGFYVMDTKPTVNCEVPDVVFGIS